MKQIYVAHFVGKYYTFIRRIRVKTRFRWLAKLELMLRGYRPEHIIGIEKISIEKSEVTNL